MAYAFGQKHTQKITPHLWFDKEAKEAAELYVAAFGETSKVKNVATLHDTPSGSVDLVTFELRGFELSAISGGPLFKPNPSVSFIVNIDPSREQDARKKIDTLWDTLSSGGTVRMPLDTYPFSARYGWLEDKYGLSWQLILSNSTGGERPEIVPSLLFVGDVCGKAEEAINFYTSVFSKRGQSSIGNVVHYKKGQEPEKEGTVMFADFMLLGQWFAAMDSARNHEFSFNEGISLIVHCDTQEEIDDYWEKLSAVPEAEQCGWLKDKYGLSWQIVPSQMDEILRKGTPEQIRRVTQAFLTMKKLDVAALAKAAEGK